MTDEAAIARLRLLAALGRRRGAWASAWVAAWVGAFVAGVSGVRGGWRVAALHAVSALLAGVVAESIRARTPRGLDATGRLLVLVIGVAVTVGTAGLFASRDETTALRVGLWGTLGALAIPLLGMLIEDAWAAALRRLVDRSKAGEIAGVRVRGDADADVVVRVHEDTAYRGAHEEELARLPRLDR